MQTHFLHHNPKLIPPCTPSPHPLPFQMAMLTTPHQYPLVPAAQYFYTLLLALPSVLQNSPQTRLALTSSWTWLQSPPPASSLHYPSCEMCLAHCQVTSALLHMAPTSSQMKWFPMMPCGKQWHIPNSNSNLCSSQFSVLAAFPIEIHSSQRQTDPHE